MNHEIENLMMKLFRIECERPLEAEDFSDICSLLRISKIYYQYGFYNHLCRDAISNELVVSGVWRDGRIYFYDDGQEAELARHYTYYLSKTQHVDCFIVFSKEIEESQLDEQLLKRFADVAYLLISRQNLLAMLNYTEQTDMLTGICNSKHLGMSFSRMYEKSGHAEHCIVFLNIQNFKLVNEDIGNKLGDAVLRKYAIKLYDIVHPTGVVGRMGGDNFVMVVPSEQLNDILSQIEKITVKNIDGAPGKSFTLLTWVGVTRTVEGKENSFMELCEQASIACSLGKKLLKENVVEYSEELKNMLGKNRKIITMFYPAIRNREFVPFFQAKVDMKTGKLAGFEALCRWIHNGSFIYPDQFIPVLDREGLLHDVDIAIFRETCLAIRRWKNMELDPPRISSNFSRNNLFVPGIEDEILGIIENCGLRPSDVEIEITETIKDDEYGRLIEFISILHKHGVHISVDDFGTGYSSLSLIHNVDADVIKIDKSFVDEIIENQKSRVLIESVLSIAERLHMLVIAEGVETVEQGRMLLQLGCRYGQGYYYSKPVSFEEATDLIIQRYFEPIAG